MGAAHVAPEQPLAAKAAELLDYVTRQPPSRRVLGPEASATAYAGHSTTELLRSVAVLKACQVKPLVRNAEALIRLAESTVGPRITHAAIGATFYPQFAAGVDLEAVRCSAADLSARGVHAVLDYSAESDLEHATDDPSAIDRQCELNLRRTIESVRAAAAVTPAGAAPMIACKVTAFASVAVLGEAPAARSISG